MSSTRRSTKRSVLGIQVAAKRDTGYYDSATLVDVTNKQVAGASFPSTNGCTGDKFLLKFEDATTQWYLERHIIGQGFQAISSACLPIGQLVYCTVGHREAPGRLTVLPTNGGELFQVTLEDGSGQVISRKQEDMRLVKSRKSARITAAKDYHSLALGITDIPLESLPELPIPTHSIATLSRKRAIPLDVGDLSKPCTGHLSCKSSYREDDALLYESPDADSDESNLGTEEAENREDGDVLMDECSAALVLMSLGASPGYKAYDLHDDAGFLSGASCSSVYGSSWPFDSNSRQRVLGTRALSPSSFHDSTSTTASSDEGIEVASTSHIDPCHLDHDYSAWVEPSDWGPLERPRKRRPSNSVMFRCTWPECQHVESTRAGVKRHIQNVHFTSAGLPAEDLEFYYNEIDGIGYIDFYSPSTPPSERGSGTGSASASASGRGFITGHRQRSALSTSSDMSTASRHSKSSTAKPINIPRLSKRRDWESSSAPHSALFDGHSTSSSGGSSKQLHLLKGRDVKKCRKVYGMDNRDMWCTQCKWKKACTRFAE